MGGQHRQHSNYPQFPSAVRFIMCPAQQNCVVVSLIPSWVTGLGPPGIEQVLPLNIKPSMLTELDKTAQ